MVIAEEWRVLLYPIGLFSALAFSLRFLLQWIQSEKKGKSVVSAPFWWLSILGNSSLGVHALIQGQFPVYIVQVINGIIAGRNLNLMKQKDKQWLFWQVTSLFIFSIVCSLFLFWLFSSEAWFRTPTHPLQKTSSSPSWGWHLVGSLGVVLFASRFWVQWIQAEREQKSVLEAPFWWLSVIGALASVLYFWQIQDYVNLVGPLFGLIPYCRNLVLLRRSHETG